MRTVKSCGSIESTKKKKQPKELNYRMAAAIFPFPRISAEKEQTSDSLRTQIRYSTYSLSRRNENLIEITEFRNIL